ncbi:MULTISPECIES: GntR family transcriptional regulator [Sporosarcina]|uniref:GntR family transcriptional regulator n=1 Tax=Sporosarcina contaminans TaxID=633403 RepID=A0ABW3TTQ7_9BACL
MLIQIEPDSDIPIYTQLAQQLIELIAKGRLKPQDTLPSVRSLAADLGVNMHTVNKAYHELEKKKIIDIIPKSGAVIKVQPDKGTNTESINQLALLLKPLIAEAIVYGMTQEEIHALTTSLKSEIMEE